jgi:hypothetical protein
MKFLKYFFAFIVVSFLSACVDMEETIVLNEDNSGTYNITIDMGKFFELKNERQQSNSSKAPEKKDTLINLKDLMNESNVLTEAEKNLYKDAVVKVKLDEAKAEMKIVMTCPFPSIDKLAEVKKNFFNVVEKLKAFDKIEKRDKNTMADADSEELPTNALNPGNDKHQEFTAVAGLIENKITSLSEYKNTLASDSAMQMMQQLTAMMGEMNFKTTITTAKEIKNYTGNKAVLSNNKKSVSFVTTFTEMMEAPDKMGYKVEF